MTEPKAAPGEPTPFAPYDALLLLSFGGPEQPAEVLPFLQNVTAGRGIPQARLDEVAQHYLKRGGRSPINDQNRALIRALEAEIARRGLQLPVLWGNRNWAPYVTDTLREAWESGHRRLVTVLTSAYSSYSSCRQYREDLASAVITLAAEGRTVDVDKVPPYYGHDSFVTVMTDATRAALERLPEPARGRARLLFVTHSIPDAMNDASGPPGTSGVYAAQHEAVAARIVEALGPQAPAHDLVFCSRSGPPSQPWLEPDINDHLELLASKGLIGPQAGVVVVPIGFVSDHMEVVFDLDDEAAATARGLGVPFERAATVGTDPRFVAGLVDLVEERAQQARGAVTGPAEQHAAGPEPGTRAGTPPAICPAGCCRNLRADRPAACGADWSAPTAIAAEGSGAEA